MKTPIYITGHRHPDTDSIVSSIAYAQLKRYQGINAIPCRLGELNDETKYLLNRFKFDEPAELKDARLTLKEIDLIEPNSVLAHATLFETLQLMQEYDQPYMAVMDNNQLVGMITRNDIGHIGLGDTALGIDLLKQTSLDNICKTLDGKIIYEDKQMHLNGKVSLIALATSKTENYDVENRIVIIGDDSESQLKLIQKGAGLLIVVWAKTIAYEVIEAAKKYHCPIIISGYGGMNTSRYLYFSPSVSSLMKTKLITFYDYEYVEDVFRKMQKTRIRSFPVVNKNKELLGYVLKSQVMNAERKKIIMVDHNEFTQSVPNIEKGEVLEVVDHHRIYDFYSSKPIAFRNEIIGSTSTIIASMFLERHIALSKNLAGLLLSAMISDTLNFQSPTSTERDLEIAFQLEEISGLNSEDLAYDMFFIGSDITNKSVIDFLNGDVKVFEINSFKVMIAQVIVPSIDSITHRDIIQEELDKNMHKNGYDLGVLAFTSVTENGSLFYLSGPLSNVVKDAMHIYDESLFAPNVVSRKKQIVPMMTDIILNNI